MNPETLQIDIPEIKNQIEKADKISDTTEDFADNKEPEWTPDQQTLIDKINETGDETEKGKLIYELENQVQVEWKSLRNEAKALRWEIYHIKWKLLEDDAMIDDKRDLMTIELVYFS